MRVSRVVLSLSVAVAVTASAIAVSSPASAAEIHYAALGDSIASGVGAGDYDENSGDCKRSPNAYPQLWAGSHTVASFRFAACAGAVTDDIAKQVTELSAATTLVTVQIGGNDAGFEGIISLCLNPFLLDFACVDGVDHAKKYIREGLPNKLAGAYSAIRNAAPNAAVTVLGYPRLYQVPGSGSCIGGSDVKRTAMNSATDEMNTVIKAQAEAAGFKFLDVTGAFANHELCSSDWWFNGFFTGGDSFHPNRDGHSEALLSVLNAATG